MSLISRLAKPWLMAMSAQFFLAGCLGLNGGGTPSAGRWREPELKKLQSLTEISSAVSVSSRSPQPKKIIYIGVYGGNPPPREEAEWFDPRHWPYYPKVDPLSDKELDEIALRQSGLDAIGLRVGALFPHSVTLILKADSDLVADIVERLYLKGDKVYLAGHSFGGSVVGYAARELKKRKIPVQMTAQMESVWADGLIPDNVVRAFNFYVPSRFALCPGRERVEAEDSSVTHVTNEAIPDPKGPYDGLCAEHRNLDNDPRVWKSVVDYVVRSAAAVF